MAWQCSSSSNGGLVDNLVRGGLCSNARVIAALRATDRRNFLRPQDAAVAYDDSPQVIGHAATISAPHMHAMTLECLHEHLGEGRRFLDVGSGSGIMLAAAARMIGPSGHAVGVELIGALVDASAENLRRDAPDLLAEGRIEVHAGDGWRGWPAGAPYDAIHVGAAADAVPPALLDQLGVGGRMVIPVGPDGGTQALVQLDKDAGGRVHRRTITSVMYVPLVHVKGKEAEGH